MPALLYSIIYLLSCRYGNEALAAGETEGKSECENVSQIDI